MGRTGSARSTGCNTCLRRRVKCDEGHPTCGRCQKSGYVCQGYERQHRFVCKASRAIRHTQSVTAFAQSRSKAEFVHALSPRSTIPPNLDFSAFKNHICVAYLLSNLPVDAARPVSWIRIEAKDMTSLVAQYSIHALSAAFFGRRHRQGDMSNQAAISYSHALRLLNDDLQNSEKAWSLSVLSIITILTIYEFIAVSSKTGWLNHVGGIGRLVELRGPWKHQDLSERRLLEANRLAIVVDYLKRGKRCFLERPEWKTIPWALEPASKTALCYLEDILCDVPGLKADAISIQNPDLEPAQRTLSSMALSRNIMEHINKLYLWRIKWEKDNPHACQEDLTLRPLDEQYLFPTRLYFTSLALAHEIIFYNVTLLMLLQLGAGTVRPMLNTSISRLPSTTIRGPLYTAGEAPDVLAVATEICKIAEYILSASQERTSVSLLFPLKVVCLAFPPTSREAKWLDKAMTRIADLGGFEVGRNSSSQKFVGEGK